MIISFYLWQGIGGKHDKPIELCGEYDNWDHFNRSRKVDNYRGWFLFGTPTVESSPMEIERTAPMTEMEKIYFELMVTSARAKVPSFSRWNMRYFTCEEPEGRLAHILSSRMFHT